MTSVISIMANRYSSLILLAIALNVTQVQAESVPRITVATTRYGGVQLMTIGIDGSNPVQLTNEPEDATQPAWSADGSKIAYVVGPLMKGRIKIADADGKNGKYLLDDTAPPQRLPQWSPDGKQIVLAMYIEKNQGHNAFLVNADGTGLTDLDSVAPASLDPAWSPRGNKIACVSHPKGTPGWIWVMNSDGTERISVVTGNLGVAVFPAWSPDEKQIAFGAPDENKKIQLNLVNADGTGQTVLTHGAKGNSYAAWSPDGQYLAYVSEPGGRGCDLSVYDVVADEHRTVLKGELFQELRRDGRPAWMPTSPASK
jgi:TolB protein